MPIPWMLGGYLIASFMPVGGWGEVDVIRGDVCQDTELATATLPHRLQLVGAMVADVMLNHESSLHYVIIIRESGNNTWYLYLLHTYLYRNFRPRCGQI